MRGNLVASTQDLTVSWARVGVVAGFLAVVSYTLISALSPPLGLGLVLVSVFGPSLGVASVGLYHILRLETRTVALDLGVASNVVAGVAVTLMFFAQLGLKEWFASHVAGGKFDVAKAVADADLATAKGVYLGLDVAWDLFIVLGTVLLAWSMRGHVRFGGLFTWSGLAIATALLVLNLLVFPEPPSTRGRSISVRSLDCGTWS